jgi:hypothetical protein
MVKRIRCKLDEVLKERNMEAKTLHLLTVEYDKKHFPNSKRLGVREATLGEMRKDINKTFSRESLEKIVNVLNLEDINELIELVDEDEQQKDAP